MQRAPHFVVVSLVAALTACSSTPPQPAPASPAEMPAATADLASYDAAWAELARLEKDERTDDARRLVVEQIGRADFGLLPEQRQYQWVHSAGVFAVRGGEYRTSHQVFKSLSQMPMATEDDWALRFLSAHYAKDPADAIFSLTTVVVRYPERLRRFDSSFLIRALISQPYRAENSNARLQLLNALYEADWKAEYGLEPNAVWADFVELLMERGEAERAASVAARITSPRILLSMRVDKRFEPLVRGNPTRFDVDAAVRADFAIFERLSAASPRKLALKSELITMCLESAQYQRAWDLASAVINDKSRETAYDDYADHINWILDGGGYALRRLGRWSEALRYAEEAAGRLEQGNPNVSNAINLGALHAQFGRSREALAALGNMAFETEGVSEYGGMQIQHVLLLAAIADHDDIARQNALEYMEEHQSAAMQTYQLALVDANELDKAAELLIRRLKDPTLRSDALLDMQDYRTGKLAPLPLASAERWRKIARRPDVQAVLVEVGRIEKSSLAPQMF